MLEVMKKLYVGFVKKKNNKINKRCLPLSMILINTSIDIFYLFIFLYYCYSSFYYYFVLHVSLLVPGLVHKRQWTAIVGLFFTFFSFVLVEIKKTLQFWQTFNVYSSLYTCTLGTYTSHLDNALEWVRVWVVLVYLWGSFFLPRLFQVGFNRNCDFFSSIFFSSLDKYDNNNNDNNNDKITLLDLYIGLHVPSKFLCTVRSWWVSSLL